MKFNCLNCDKEKQSHPSCVNKYCSKYCQTDFNYKENVKAWKEGKFSGNKGVNSVQVTGYVKKYIEEKFQYKCVFCGIGNSWNNKPLTLQLEHLDGDSTNTREENLSLLCPNCHTQTPFYGSKNKGRGRGTKFKRD